MVKYCCVLNCKSNSRIFPKLNFHVLPKDPIWKNHWLDCVGRSEFKYEVVRRIRYVCGEHFEKNMLAGFGTFTLKGNAVPTIFKEGCGYKGVNDGTSSSIFTVAHKNIKENKTLGEVISPHFSPLYKTTDESIVSPPIFIKVEPEEACESHMDYNVTSEVLSAIKKETDIDFIKGESVVVKEEPTEIIEKECAKHCLNCTIKYLKQCTKSNVCEEINLLEKLKVRLPHLK